MVWNMQGTAVLKNFELTIFLNGLHIITKGLIGKLNNDDIQFLICLLDTYGKNWWIVFSKKIKKTENYGSVK